MKKILIYIIYIIDSIFVIASLYSIWLLADNIPSIFLGLYILAGVPFILVIFFSITNFLLHKINNEK